MTIKRSQHIRVRGLRRSPVDHAKLGRALLELAHAQREKEAQAEHEQRQNRPSKPAAAQPRPPQDPKEAA